MIRELERKNFSLVALTPLRDFHLTERDETNISPKKKKILLLQKLNRISRNFLMNAGAN